MVNDCYNYSSIYLPVIISFEIMIMAENLCVHLSIKKKKCGKLLYTIGSDTPEYAITILTKHA